MEMVPMLQVSQNSNGPVTTCVGTLNVKESPNASHRSEELSVCHPHYTEHANKPNANNQDERMSESQNPLKCNKRTSTCSGDHFAPNAKQKSCTYEQTQIGCQARILLKSVSVFHPPPNDKETLRLNLLLRSVCRTNHNWTNPIVTPFIFFFFSEIPKFSCFVAQTND